jgi:hypothetical protein
VRRSLRNSIRCFDEAAAIAATHLRLLRHASRLQHDGPVRELGLKPSLNPEILMTSKCFPVYPQLRTLASATGMSQLGQKQTFSNNVISYRRHVGRRSDRLHQGRQVACAGSDNDRSSRTDFAKFVAAETEKWAKVVRFYGAKPD